MELLITCAEIAVKNNTILHLTDSTNLLVVDFGAKFGIILYYFFFDTLEEDV